MNRFGDVWSLPIETISWICYFYWFLPTCKKLKAQFILEIRLDYYLSLLWACSGMPKQTHLKQPNNISCFHGPLVISINSTSRLNSFMRFCSLKNPAFWFALTFLDHNSRTKFFPNTLFLQKVKRSLTLSCWSKKEYLNR